MKILRKDKLDGVFEKIRANGFDIFAPVENEGNSRYAKIERADEISFDMILPKGTLKEIFFPRSECLLRYKIAKRKVDVEEADTPNDKRVIFGVRPCDAAGVGIDDAVFSWDYRDDSWFARRNNTIVISIACVKSDDFCMCTSVGSSPDDKRASDVMLYPLADESGWSIEEITDKGREIISSVNDLIEEAASEVALAELASVPVRFEIDKVTSWLNNRENFDSKFWDEISQRCIGCGVCTYLCPTCHCFDIQDEGDVYSGVRRRNWDSCSFALFTLHTSGHNPRATQASRWRQRIMHKFNYYPEKFNLISCTGCGRCTRYCPVDMGITETLERINMFEQ